MRLDLFLKISRLVIRRTVAQSLCMGSSVQVNGITAKPSKEVQVNDVICLKQRDRQTIVKVLEVPPNKSSRFLSNSLYELVSNIQITNEL